ncbi:MAG: excinuclease ABC subunit C [Candidatus Firestonebacteria bacterium RIFOXYC2_FULL_39_67]|nr:MAG: excinuclease ABC subunit C [Candidatus Firestonebacteria bacterium RIFOXYD2_FULL_39_29]OGF53607.1 MAG: excinuclease ABC subunit C [Candidatus Firestonebacteria bacterium RIFOXYC2_FULL_39_67]
MTKYYFVYIMTNKNNTVLYTGVTNNIIRRVYEHREGIVEGFTKKYNIKKLVYFKTFDDVGLAIDREKQIKAGSRAKKEILINSINKDWKDLWDDIKG